MAHGNKKRVGDHVVTIEVVVPTGTSPSSAVQTDGLALVGIAMPGAWVAADLTFQTSVDGSTYLDVYSSDGAEVPIKVGASRFVQVDPSTWFHLDGLKVRSGTAASPVDQTTDRTLQFVFREVA